MFQAFYDLHIEDMWLPFFCNTTNILTSKMETHESGYAWRYIRSLLTLFMRRESFLTHEYLGASMTLVGLVPPLCDNGNVLVDGGYSEYSCLLAEYTLTCSLCSGQSSRKLYHHDQIVF